MRMRKISLIFLGLIAGAGLTLLATQTHTVFVDSSANAAFSNAFRELDGHYDSVHGATHGRVRCCFRPPKNSLVNSGRENV
jgi:hypothetical protein